MAWWGASAVGRGRPMSHDLHEREGPGTTSRCGCTPVRSGRTKELIRGCRSREPTTGGSPTPRAPSILTLRPQKDSIPPTKQGDVEAVRGTDDRGAFPIPLTTPP